MYGLVKAVVSVCLSWSAGLLHLKRFEGESQTKPEGSCFTKKL
jgi:hypothetical protein